MSGLRLPGGPWGGNRRAKSLVVSVHHAQRPTELALEVNLEALRSALEIAISSEDYTAAAKLRDQIREVEQQDPLIPLKAELEIAIAEERYVSV